jgi:hypothetical protein
MANLLSPRGEKTMIAKFFPTSVGEQEKASSAPLSFFLRDFVRVAVIVAVIQVIFYAVIPSTRASSWPDRVYYVISFAGLMAGLRVWAARHNRS